MSGTGSPAILIDLLSNEVPSFLAVKVLFLVANCSAFLSLHGCPSNLNLLDSVY